MKRQGFGSPIGRPGDDRLSHEWARSTIGAQGFHGRVRNGFGWFTLAVITRPSDRGVGRPGFPGGEWGRPIGVAGRFLP